MYMNQKIASSMPLKIFKFKEALDRGLTRRTISRKIKTGEFLRLSHGLYLNVNTDLPIEHIDFIVAQNKFGEKSVICGLTSLFYHGLIEQAPQQIWVMVPQEIRTRDKKYRVIRAKTVKEYGIVPNHPFRICDINRSIVEAFNYSTKIGIRTAMSAIVRAIKEKQTTMPEIMNTARELGLQNPIKRHWESIIGMMEV